VGRLENIAQRNKHPWKLKGTLAFGVRSVFLLVIIGMMIFSDCGRAPEDHRPGINVVPARDPGVRDVKLWKQPTKK
jgi:hypothetical protein